MKPNLIRSLTVLSAASLVAGCLSLEGSGGAPGSASVRSGPSVLSYEMTLQNLDRVPEYGTEVPVELEQRGGSAVRFADDLVRLDIVPARGVFSVRMSNETNATMRFLWDDGAYIDAHGISSGLVSGETRRIHIGQSQQPAVIPAGASVDLTVIPRGHIADVGGGRTHIHDFVSMCGTAEEYEGKVVRLLLAVQTQDRTVEYTAHYELTGVFVPTPSPIDQVIYCGRR